MSAPTGQTGLTPGECITILKQCDKWRDHGYRVTDLPPRQRDDLTDCLQQVRRWIDADRAATLQDEALKAVQKAVDANALGNTQSFHLRTLWRYLITVTPTRRVR
jgi:hypothetical protein